VDKGIIWIDIETTGLDPSVDGILEIAVVVTDPELRVEGVYQSVIKPEEDALINMSLKVANMHTVNGLLDELHKGISPKDSAEQIVLMFQTMNIRPMAFPMGGNSIHFDRSFLDAHMLPVSTYCSKRNLDVSALAEMGKLWYPDAMKDEPVKKKHHRALEDIQESIEQLKFLKKRLIK
jgi:oligoribonuclease